MDSRGNRFLKRFAGSDDFQKRLNHGRREPRDFGSGDSRMGPGTFTPQPEINSDYSAPSYGPNFDTQVRRERGIQAEQKYNDDRASSDIFNKYSSGNRNVQKGRSDGLGIANKYINSAKETNPIDIVALDKHIRRGPMYHEAKSELAGLLTYGDKYRNAREGNLNWSNPDPSFKDNTPDFDNMYDRFKEDLDDIEV